MPQIHAPELATEIRRHYGIRGQQGFDTIAPEIIPVTIVDQIVPGRRLAAGSQLVAAVALEFSFCALVSTPDSLVRVLRAIVSTGTAGDAVRVIFSTATSITASAGTKHWMDRRIRGAPGALVVGGTLAGALPIGESGWLFRTLANTPTQLELGITLSPVGGVPESGSSRIIIATGSSELAVSWMWEEGPARPGDRVS